MKYIILLLFLSSSLSSEISPPNAATDSEASPFVLRGWLKFFTYTPSFSSSSAPTRFDYNPAYKAQFSWGSGPSFTERDRDQWGWFDIIDDTHFFLILTKTTLYAVYSRRNDIAKTYKSLEIKWIDPGKGLEDLGNYREGFCFRLISRTNVIWNICADTMGQKNRWMTELRALISLNPTPLNVQNSTGGVASFILAPEIQLPFQINQGSQPIPETGASSPGLGKPGAKIDGKWVILQDWTQCSQICGGGKQYLQRMCLPPQNGGIPCDGDSLLSRDCNSQACPEVVVTEKQGPANPTMIRMMPLSDRPLRYEICVIREIDLDLAIETPQFAFFPKYPVRVILNNKTLSIFSTPSFENVYKSFDLNYLNVKLSPKESKLCHLYSDTRDPSKSATLCVMPTAVKESESIEKYKENWIHDIFFFRDKCRDKNKEVDESPEIKKKRMQVEVEAQQDKIMRIREKEDEDQQKVVEKKVQEKAKFALSAVEKEAKFEQLALEEELMREKQEENMLNQMIEKEQERKSCMEREIKKRQRMSEMAKQTLELAERASELERQATLQVQDSRRRFKERMAKLKRAAERKRREVHKKIEELRTTMTENIMKDNFIGNVRLCNPLRPNVERDLYCEKNFENEPDKNSDCRQSADDFCYVCCENEFGKNQFELRERCYHLCDNVENGLDEKGAGFGEFQDLMSRK